LIDPISAVGIATSAFNAIKHGISVGRDLQDMTGQLSQWGKPVSDFNYGSEQQSKQPWYSFKGSDEETALQIFAQKQKMEQMRKEIKNHISFVYGPSAWEEVLSIEAKMRKERKEELYRKEELKRAIIEWTVGILASVIGIAVMGFILFIIGKNQGKW